jgi:hypothetical protein
MEPVFPPRLSSAAVVDLSVRMVGLANFLKKEFACSSPTKKQAGSSCGRLKKRYG